MDHIIDRLVKKIPLGIVVGCLMIDYKVLPSVFYPGFDDDNIENIQNVFSKLKYVRITEGTIITSRSVIPFMEGSYNIEKISEFLKYPCSLGRRDNGHKVSVNVSYKDMNDVVLTMYCRDKTDKVDEFIERIVSFMEKVNKKMNKHQIEIEITETRYYTIKKLRDIIDKGGVLNNDQRDCVEDIMDEYGYGLLLSLHEDDKIDMYSKRSKNVLSLIMRLCELEQMSMFIPSTPNIRTETIIEQLKSNNIYKVTKKDKTTASDRYNIVL